VTPSPTPDVTPSPKPEASPTPKPLFDPIIITIGKTEKPNKEKTTEDPKPEAAPTPQATPTPKPETTPDPEPSPVDPVPNEQTPDDPTGETRRRVVARERSTSPCTIVVSQEVLSIIAGGGSLGILVGFDDELNDPKSITAVSSSSDDVRVMPDPAVGVRSRRAFFVVRSVSEKTAEFRITFRAECGTKDIQVKVR
jgi:outer membrane biosynthesis protein TonB